MLKEIVLFCIYHLIKNVYTWETSNFPCSLKLQLFLSDDKGHANNVTTYHKKSCINDDALDKKSRNSQIFFLKLKMINKSIDTSQYNSIII